MNEALSARERIRRAAVHVMARRGIAGATTQDIARRARCSQAAIYKYWDGKETLARELFEEVNAGLIEAMEAACAASEGPRGRIQGTLLGLLLFARSHPDGFAFLFHVFHSEYAVWLVSHPKPRDLVRRELDRAVRDGQVPDGNREVKTALLLGMAIRLAFFERQGLVRAEAASAEETLWKAAAEVLEV